MWCHVTLFHQLVIIFSDMSDMWRKKTRVSTLRGLWMCCVELNSLHYSVYWDEIKIGSDECLGYFPWVSPSMLCNVLIHVNWPLSLSLRTKLPPICAIVYTVQKNIKIGYCATLLGRNGTCWRNVCSPSEGNWQICEQLLFAPVERKERIIDWLKERH